MPWLTETRDPVFNIHFSYTDHQERKVSYIRSVRAPDEMNARLWVQKITAVDCAHWGTLQIYESKTLQNHDSIPHIYDLDDIEKEILHKVPLLGDAAAKIVTVEVPFPKLPDWAEAFHIWPGKGLGTTKTSNTESFYDAAEGAYE